MSKWSKRLLGLVAVGSVIAGIAYYLKKSECCCDDDYMDDFEDEDFDLDNDLKPVTDREYVPLNSAAKEEDTAGASTQAAVTEESITQETLNLEMPGDSK